MSAQVAPEFVAKQGGFTFWADPSKLHDPALPAILEACREKRGDFYARLGNLTDFLVLFVAGWRLKDATGAEIPFSEENLRNLPIAQRYEMIEAIIDRLEPLIQDLQA